MAELEINQVLLGSDVVEDDGQKEYTILTVPEKSKTKIRKNKNPKGKKNEIGEEVQNKVEDIKKEEKWKPHEISRFLELYEMFPCLWDYKLPEYKDRNVKELAWEVIVKDMVKKDFNVKKAKDKIRVLRNTYSNELVKIQKSKSSGKGLDDVYTPTLRWFSTMDRIVGQVVQTRGTQSVGLPDQARSDTKIQENVNTPIETLSQTDEDGVDPLPRTTPAANITRIPRERPCSVIKSGGPYVRPLSKKFADQRLNKIENVVDELKGISNNLFSPGSSTVKENCEFELFGKFVSTQLKKLPEVEALGAMQDIQSCLLKRRINCVSALKPTAQWDDGFNTSTTSSIYSPDPGTDKNAASGEKDLISLAFQMINDDELVSNDDSIYEH